MNRKILLFAGTTEGRELAAFCGRSGIRARVCVATDYGRDMIPEGEFVQVSAGRLEEPEMEGLLREEPYDMVVDATHPYALAASENIRLAAERAGVPYIRVCRREAGGPAGIHVSSVDEAVDFLSHTQGNILAATGSKELVKYRRLVDYRSRVCPRILPDPAVISDCLDMGFERARLICMQGPFSQELNEAMLRHADAKWLVTKDGGREGGFEEKMEAARRAGAQVIVVGRPSPEEGYSLRKMYEYLKEYYHLRGEREVTLAGCGCGSEETLTAQAKRALAEADLCMGAPRMCQLARGYACDVREGYLPEEILRCLREHPEYEKICVLLSGDSSFYSGAAAIREALAGTGIRVQTVPGISSKAYLCARLGMAGEEMATVSLHGREGNLVYYVDTHPSVFVLLAGEDSVGRMCRELLDFGLEDVSVAVGENLSYEDEKITVGRPEELLKNRYLSLCSAVVCNPRASAAVRLGIPDREFVRGSVPMTKAEVRALTVGKLGLNPDSVVYDVGAGTGSMSVEMARQAYDGQVYAVEQEAEGIQLIRRNRLRFRTANLVPVYGRAPEALKNLPAPTHAFIGGSGGRLKDILKALLEKNPAVVIAVHAVTLETAAQVMECRRELGLREKDICLVQVAKAADAGGMHLMRGQNPVYLFIFQGPGEKTTEEGCT